MVFDDFEQCVAYIKDKAFVNIYLAGAGQYGEIVHHILEKSDIDITGYIDKKKTGNLNNKKIYDYQSFDIHADCFILTSYIWREELRSQIVTSGVDTEKIISFSNQDIFYKEIGKEFDYKSYTDRNKKFKDLYQGKRCFVIGNGPSLTVEDLDKIKGEFSIACNSIINIYKMTKWRPAFYFCWDNDYCKFIMKKREDMKYLCDNCENLFTSLGAEAIKYRDDKEFDRLHYVKAMHKYEAGEQGLPLFSADCSDAVYGAGVSAYPMIQLAAYTGVSEIYLLGMDNVYSNTLRNQKRVTHDVRNYNEIIEKADEAYFEYLGEKPQFYIDEDLVEKGYLAVEKYCRANHIRIYNATRGGALEIFPRVDLDKLI